MFVFDCPDADGRHVAGVVCNPVITLPEGRDCRLDEDDEGCLSFPGAFVECARPDFAEVVGSAPSREPVAFAGDGLLARCLQHETDHTHGTVFGDRLPTCARKRLDKAHAKVADNYPDGWPPGPDRIESPGRISGAQPHSRRRCAGGGHVEESIPAPWG